MADEEDEEVQDGEEIAFESEDGEFEGPAPGKKSRLKKLLFIILPVILLIGVGAGAYLSGLLDPLLGGGGDHGDEMAEEDVEEDHGPATYYELPEMLVNLYGTGRRTNYLKITVALEVTGKDAVPHLEEVLPRIVDSFQVFLRELRVDDLRGSAGMYQLKEELLLRVNAATGSTEVRDVLFREMLVQ